ncbi:MAG: cytochrome C [Gammaproteobacteria bacterium]
MPIIGTSYNVRMLQSLAKIVAALAVITAVAVGGAWAWYFVILPPDLPVPDIAIERTPERVARGEYLATAVFGCMYCHSERDWSLFGAPPKPGTLGKGGERFDQSVGVSGVLIAPNITPHNLGDWSDGEVYRAIISGLHKDGYAFFPIMPFDVYLHLETEDVYSIIAYLRTLEPIESEFSGRRMTRLMTFIAHSRVLPADPWEIDKADPVQRGEYLARIAGCRFCHTPANERMQPYEDQRFAGGLRMLAPGDDGPRGVYSANVTPDIETGIGNWTVEQFIARFKAYQGARIPVTETGFQTQHAWTEYAKITESDLADIYAYLMSHPPVRNAVDPAGGPER